MVSPLAGELHHISPPWRCTALRTISWLATYTNEDDDMFKPQVGSDRVLQLYVLLTRSQRT